MAATHAIGMIADGTGAASSGIAQTGQIIVLADGAGAQADQALVYRRFGEVRGCCVGNTIVKPQDYEIVIRPLADIRPDLVLPTQTETVGALLSRLPASGVVRLDLEW